MNNFRIRFIAVALLSLGLVFVGCEKKQDDKKSGTTRKTPANVDTSEKATETGSTSDPSLSELEQGKSAIEGRLESLLALIEKKERTLMKREDELYERERALIAKSAALNDREERQARLRIASWIVLALGIVALVAGVIISRRPGDRTSSESGKDFREKTQSAQNEFVKKMEAELEKVDAKIAEMKKKAENATDEAKTEYKKQIRSLQGKKSSFQRKLNELQNASGQAWEEFKAGVQKAVDDLKKASDDAASKMK